LEHEGRLPPSQEGNVEPSAQDGRGTELGTFTQRATDLGTLTQHTADPGTLTQLIADLKQTIIRQSNIIENQNNGIENILAELVEIKTEQ